MANVKNLKKDINYVLGDIIEAVYLYELTTTGRPTEATNGLIDEAISTFDALIVKVNAKIDIFIFRDLKLVNGFIII